MEGHHKLRIERGLFSKQVRRSARRDSVDISRSRSRKSNKARVQQVTKRLHQSQRTFREQPSAPVQKLNLDENKPNTFFLRQKIGRLERELRDRDKLIQMLYQTIQRQNDSSREQMKKANRQTHRLRKAYQAKVEQCETYRRQRETLARDQRQPSRELQLLRQKVLILSERLRDRECRLAFDKENQSLAANSSISYIGDKSPLGEVAEEELYYSAESDPGAQPAREEVAVREDYSPAKENHLRVRSGDVLVLLETRGASAVVMRGNDIGIVPRSVLVR